MTTIEDTKIERRIYPLDPRKLTEEQVAVAFAMTSRSPDPFDVIAQRVTEEKAADFNERWVLNYGHSSVAEHAVLHMAVENISRVACDELEDNRLASYTEKSSRYQVIAPGYYHVPKELDGSPLRETFVAACDYLFHAYGRAVDGIQDYLPDEMPRREDESERAYVMRLRRVATDSARFLLPAATLTNAGVTINARGMEHMVRKLLSSDLIEEQEIGQELKGRGQEITPTLIKYANYNEYLAVTSKAMRKRAGGVGKQANPDSDSETESGLQASLVHFDSQAEQKLVAALLYRYSPDSYTSIWDRVSKMTANEREQVIKEALHRLGSHDIPLREFETVDYTFDLLMDYGAYREYKRHRMQTYIAQPLTVSNGYVMPPLFERAGLGAMFEEAMQKVETSFNKLAQEHPRVAGYLVTHAHKRRVLSKMNLRECYHLFKLRTQPTAHFTLREVVGKAMELARKEHPLLFKYLRLRS
jgi:thymidylate synthase ThyX